MEEIEKNVSVFHIHKNRNVTENFKDTLQYLSADAMMLLQTVSLFSLLPVFAGLLVAFIFLDHTPRPESVFYIKNSLPKPQFILYILCCLLLVLGYCTTTFVVNKLLLIRDKSSIKYSRPLFKELKKDLNGSLKNYIFNFFIIYILYYGVSFGLNYLERAPILTGIIDWDSDPINYITDWSIKHLPPFILLPFLIYFGFSSLFLSLRDDIGSSDALKKILDLSQKQFLKIWVNCLIILIVAYIGNTLINYSFYHLYALLPFNGALFFIFTSIQKLTSIGLFVFLQVGVVLFLGSLENELEGHYINNKIMEV